MIIDYNFLQEARSLITITCGYSIDVLNVWNMAGPFLYCMFACYQDQR